MGTAFDYWYAMRRLIAERPLMVAISTGQSKIRTG